jgi:hypothetical protein
MKDVALQPTRDRSDIDRRVDELVRDLAAERAERDATHQKADPGSGLCRYCGQRWMYWRGSALDGHAACLVSDEMKRRVAEVMQSPFVTGRRLAERLGVSESVVRSWWKRHAR